MDDRLQIWRAKKTLLIVDSFRYEQCDQFGRSLKVLGDKFSYKNSQIYLVTFCAILKIITSEVKTLVATFWVTFEKQLGYFLFQHLATLDTNRA